MTPQEKAKKLWEYHYFYNRFMDSKDRRYVCKMNALITVDEILTIVHTIKQEQYWQQVKQEIQKL